MNTQWAVDTSIDVVSTSALRQDSRDLPQPFIFDPVLLAVNPRAYTRDRLICESALFSAPRIASSGLVGVLGVGL